MVEFTGAARKLTREDYVDDAAKAGCSEAHLHAVIEIESSGSGFDSHRRLKACFEPHRFYAILKKAGKTAVLQHAIALGVAYASWRPGNYPKDPYPRLTKALALDETAALEATSWGLPQIMGENHKAAGYASAQEMIAAFVDSEDEQVEAMVRFIKAKKLGGALANGQWNKFADGYNGAAQRKHNYAGRLEAAYKKWVKKLAGLPASDSVTHVSEAQVIQQLLKGFGYEEIGLTNGDLGGRTKGVVTQFWHDRTGEDRTGVIDEALKNEIDAAHKEGWHRPIGQERAEGEPENDEVIEATKSTDLVAKASLITGGTAGLGKVAQQVDAISTPVQQIQTAVSPFTDFIGQYWWVIAIVIGGFVAYEVFKTKNIQIGKFRIGKVA